MALCTCLQISYLMHALVNSKTWLAKFVRFSGMTGEISTKSIVY